jgi:hypothetical protein
MMVKYRGEILLTGVCGLFLLAGCSSYGGQKLGLDTTTNKPVPTTGIPYVLSKPEYSLTRVAGTGDGAEPTYTVTKTTVPDAAHQYSLRPKPGFLSDPDFTLTLGSGGQVTGVKTTISEQFTPMLKAVGSFASTLVSLGVFDKDSNVKGPLTAKITAEKCNTPSKTRHVDPDTLQIVKETVGQELIRRIELYEKDPTIASRLHYADQDELACLKSIRDKAVTASGIDNAKANFATTSGQYTDDDAFRQKIEDFVTKNDLESFQKAYAANTAIKDSDPTLYNKRDPFLKVANKLMIAQKADPVFDVLKTVVGLDAPTWRARHLLYLEDEISWAQLALLRLPGATSAAQKSVEQTIEGLNSARAETINAFALYERSKALSAFLETVPTKHIDGGGTAPATAEFAAARAELDLVNEKIEAARTKVLAASKAASPLPIKALKDESLVELTKGDIDASQNKDWDGKVTIAGKPVDAPKYVIVLEDAQ